MIKYRKKNKIEAKKKREREREEKEKEREKKTRGKKHSGGQHFNKTVAKMRIKRTKEQYIQ
jgi:hypothetical protein